MNKNNDIKSFIALKYQILTEDESTWYLCETYPKIVRLKWALRCSRDVEHLAKEYPSVKKCNDLTQKYINAGMPESMHGDLDKSRRETSYVAYTATAKAANHTINAAYYAADSAAYANTTKWKQYIDWLVEELCDYEASQLKE